jgi:NTP pyrophosphatase (non-canonical NTP hydrolase)
MKTVIQDVIEERLRQDDQWGEQNHDPSMYLTILTEEIGEIARAVFEARFDGAPISRIREEVVQAAAVAVAMVECIDRGKWGWPQ